MAQSSAYRTLSQNFSLGGKKELAGVALTEGNNISAMSRTPILAPAIALLVAFASSFMAKYLEDDF